MAAPSVISNGTNLSDCTCPAMNYTGGRCWPGTYCPSGSNYPVPCDGGKYCSLYGLTQPEGDCDPGYYCNGSDIQRDPSDKECPVGHYCQSGSPTPTPCPSGTSSNAVKNTLLSDCNDCPPGFYCEGTGNIIYTGPCAAGFYCPAGQQTATPATYNCTMGHYCPGGTGQPVPCNAGSYQDEQTMSDCKGCPAGRLVIHVIDIHFFKYFLFL